MKAVSLDNIYLFYLMTSLFFILCMKICKKMRSSYMRVDPRFKARICILYIKRV